MMDTPSKDVIQSAFPDINIKSDDPFGETHHRIKSEGIDFKPVGTPDLNQIENPQSQGH
jgi:hypothetical protein